MNLLLKLTSVIESLTGLALFAAPAIVVRLLFGAELGGAGVPLGRVAGFALLGLGLACWTRGDAAEDSAAALRGMLLYNVSAAAFLIYLGFQGAWVGPLLWPAAAAHAVLSPLLGRQCWLQHSGRKQ
jgi:hypothetical protein